MLACLPDHVEGGKVVGRRRERGVVQGRQGSGSKGAVMPAARAKAAAGEGSTSVRGRGGRGGGGRKQKRGRSRRGQQQGKEGRALGGEKSGKGKSRRPGGRRGGKKIRKSDLPDLKALPGTAFDCDEKNPRSYFWGLD